MPRTGESGEPCIWTRRSGGARLGSTQRVVRWGLPASAGGDMRRLPILLAATTVLGAVMPAAANANDGLRQAVAQRIGNPQRLSSGFQLWLNGLPQQPDLMHA